MKIAMWYFGVLKRLFDAKKYWWFYFCLWGVPQMMMILAISILRLFKLI